MIRSVKIFFYTIPALLISAILHAEIRTISLFNAVDLARRNNLTLSQYEKDVRIAEAQYQQSFADFALPDITADGTFTFLDPDTISSGIVDGQKFVSNASIMGLDVPVMDSVKLTNAFYDNYSASLGVTKPLFAGFRLWNALSVKKINLDLAGLKLRDKQKEIEMNVNTSFYNLFLILENIRLTEEMDRSLKERLAYTRANYLSGIVPEYDLIKANVQHKNNLPKLARIRNAYQTAKLAFCNLIGITDYENTEFLGNLMDSTNTRIEKISESEAIHTARSNDISLRTLDATLETLKLTREISAAGRYPSLSAYFNYKYDLKKKSTYDLERQWIGSWNTGLQLTIPIDDWIPISRTAQAVREMEETIARTEMARKQASDGIALQVKTLFMQIDESLQIISGQAETVKQARVGLSMANLRYRAGNSSSLEVTDAEVSLNQSQASYLQAIYEYYSSTLKLKKMIEK